VVSLSKPLCAALRASYRNPVYPGDFPDPSVIRVGKRTYYAVTTSTDWAPFFPIFRSTDLVRWTIVGHVFAQRPAWCVGNFWAPDFAENDGRFYVYYTARSAGGPLCVAVATADRPEGPYRDHGPLVGQHCGSIDAMAADDEHGHRWLLWKEDGNSLGRPTPIWAQRLSADGTVLQGQPVELLRNDAPWEGHLVEAPHVIRRDGWFYMFYSGNACCGEACAYAVGVARSRSLTGPWEKCPRNPILAGNDAFRCPGHGSPVSDAAGRWFYLYHAYERARDAIFVGRQLCVDEIAWESDGWPSINGNRGPSRVGDAPFGIGGANAHRSRWSADLTAPLDRAWQWPQGNAPIVARERHGTRISVSYARRADDPVAAVIARPMAFGNYVATATIDRGAAREGTLASLCAYGSRREALGIGVRDDTVVVWRRRAGRLVELSAAGAPQGARLRIRCTALDGCTFRFAFSADGRTWTTLGDRLDGAWLPPWDAGVRIALAVGGGTGASARFLAFGVAPTPASVTRLAENTALRSGYDASTIAGRDLSHQ
jgi:xylan 1,4-beta-xylosidase